MHTGSIGSIRLLNPDIPWRVLLTALLLCIAAPGPLLAADSFDHFTTGFPLMGRHEHIDCSSCHISGQFAGTPMECGLCHNNSRAPGKNPRHIASSDFCDDCHIVYTWTGARYDHADVVGECASCHNGTIATGKSVNHILSTSACEDCHNTITFSRVGSVDHGAVLGVCDSCHNGITATGRPPDHILTTGECDACHTTFTWSNPTVDHNNVRGECSSCHNGTTATGKPPDHILTTDECGYCHTTRTWEGATSN